MTSHQLDMFPDHISKKESGAPLKVKEGDVISFYFEGDFCVGEVVNILDDCYRICMNRETIIRIDKKEPSIKLEFTKNKIKSINDRLKKIKIV